MIKMKPKNNLSIAEEFSNFLVSKSAEGVTKKTLSSYSGHLNCISKHLDITQRISELSKNDIDEMINSMRESELSPNSIASYSSTFRAFLNWCNEEGLTSIKIPRYKAEETVKEVYSDSELELLLKKPNLTQCRFSEYRNWVIINFLLNSGARSGTIRNIQIRDVDLDNSIVTYRHTKRQKPQVIPLCSQMVKILKEYLGFRNGEDDDYLFCTEDGCQFTERGLYSSIQRYNHSRGVQKVGIHLFRHTFAKKYLLDCGGDAFTLQRILGHSTLDITRHYCNIYNVDLTKSYDNFSPLQNLLPKENRLTLNQKR